MLYKPGPLRTSVIRRSDGESRDLRSICDNLEKELERRDQRNDNLSRELLSLRATLATQQREHRIVTGTFDKLNTERIFLSNEAFKSKDHIAKLESHISKLSDSQQLLDQVSKQQQIIDTIQGKLDKSQGSLILKDDMIKSLEKELDTLHRAFDIQDRYEPRGSGVVGPTSAIQVEREKMRSLYYELGKRQSDAHSLTLTLAESSVEMNNMRQSLTEANAAEQRIQKEQLELRNQCGEVLQRNEDLQTELSQAQDKSANLKELNSKMSAQVEDLSKRLSELRTSSDGVVTEKETLVFELSSLLYSSQLEVVSLNGRVEELKQSVAHLQSTTELTEQRSMSTLNDAIAERKLLTEKLRESELVKPQLKMVHQHLQDALHEKEKKEQIIHTVEQTSQRDVAQARFVAEELQRELMDSQQQLDQAHSRTSELEDERTQALSTLQRTLEAAKSLTAKLHSEKERRITAEERAIKAERLADSLQRAKEHVSSAVLDALHLEKSKSGRLERVLQQMTKSRDFIPHPRPDAARASTSPVRTAPAEYEYDKHKSASARSSASGFADRFEPSSSNRQSYSSTPSTPTRSAHSRAHSDPFSQGSSSGATVAERPTAPQFSQSSPMRAPLYSATSAVPGPGPDPRVSAPREINFKAPIFGSPSRSVVDGLTRLRDHLREIEEGAPSPLNQSKTLSHSQSNPRPDLSGLHRYAVEVQEGDSRGDTSSMEADPEGWRDRDGPSRAVPAHRHAPDLLSGHSKEREPDVEDKVGGEQREEDTDRARDDEADRLRVKDDYLSFKNPPTTPYPHITPHLPPPSATYSHSSTHIDSHYLSDEEISLFDLAR